MILTIVGIAIIIVGIYSIIKEKRAFQSNYNKSKIIIINGVTLVLFGIYYALYQYLKYPNWTMVAVPIVLIFINICLRKAIKLK